MNNRIRVLELLRRIVLKLALILVGWSTKLSEVILTQKEKATFFKPELFDDKLNRIESPKPIVKGYEQN